MKRSEEKIQKLLETSSIELVPAEDRNRPPIPVELEEMFLVHGPKLFHWLIDVLGGKSSAEEIAGVSHSTMSRWVNSKPGQVFGQRQDMRSYRSIWFGYPSPFPGFDRIIEEINGGESSFIGYCVNKYGLKRTMEWMRGFRGYGLEMLKVDPELVLRACDDVGIPPATRRRWQSGVTYPRQWAALDKMCAHVLGMSWLEAVLRVRPGSMPRRVSKEALLCLIEESWEYR